MIIDFQVYILNISIEEDTLAFSPQPSEIPTRFWIVKLLKMVNSIRYNCLICKKLDKRPREQIMGKLPVDRLKPSPAWTCTAIDLFGPFKDQKHSHDTELSRHIWNFKAFLIT